MASKYSGKISRKPDRVDEYFGLKPSPERPLQGSLDPLRRVCRGRRLRRELRQKINKVSGNDHACYYRCHSLLNVYLILKTKDFCPLRHVPN